MIRFDPSVQAYRIQPTLLRAVLIAFFLSLFVASGLRVWQNHSRRLAWDAYRLEQKTADAASTLTMNRLRELFHKRPHPTRTDLEREFNGGKPFTLDSAGHATLRQPHGTAGTYLHSELHFEGNTWTGLSGTNAIVLPPTPSAFDDFTEKVRSRMAGNPFGIAPALWGLLFLMTLAWPRGRPVTAEFLLPAALLAFAAWLVSPYYSLTPQGIFSNDMLFWGTCILVISTITYVVIIVRLHRRRRAFFASGHCPCGYDLTGNVSGICPECGSPVSKSRTIPRAPARMRVTADMPQAGAE
jgi:hypothetical protein